MSLKDAVARVNVFLVGALREAGQSANRRSERKTGANDLVLNTGSRHIDAKILTVSAVQTDNAPDSDTTGYRLCEKSCLARSAVRPINWRLIKSGHTGQNNDRRRSVAEIKTAAAAL